MGLLVLCCVDDDDDYAEDVNQNDDVRVRRRRIASLIMQMIRSIITTFITSLTQHILVSSWIYSVYLYVMFVSC